MSLLDKHVLNEDSYCAECPSLDDYWKGTADFIVTERDTGLPMGESDTVILPNGIFRSYAHASFESAGVVDSCGDPVDFPGCVITLQSKDGGYSFKPTTNEDGADRPASFPANPVRATRNGIILISSNIRVFYVSTIAAKTVAYGL